MSEGIGPPPPATLSVAWLDEVDGDIVGCGYCPLAEREMQVTPAGVTRHDITMAEHTQVSLGFRRFAWVEGALAARSPVTITLSATSIAADGVEELEVTGIPDGARLRVSGAVSLPWTVITGGEAVLTASVPGSVMLELRCPAPHADWMGGFDAV